MPDPAAERLIADRYALAVPIGQGGMGVVWRARDTLLGREVAIKEVRLPQTIPDSERSSMRARVLREARAAAHQAGIVHRDVKPANVMVVADGARLTDFGIARVKGDPKLTSTGLIVGSPAYMAPEQASGAAAGPEADLWGLGATLYYAVEGRPPFERDGQIAVLTAVVNEQPRATTRAGPLAPIIAALLSKDPKRRPDAAELRSQLEDLAAGLDAAAEAGRGAVVAGRGAAEPAPVAGRDPAPEEPTAVAAEPATREQPEPVGDEALPAVSPGDTEQLPELDDVPAAAPPPPPGKPFEPTRPGPSRPGYRSPAHVRPDQPARPASGSPAPMARS